MICAYNLIDSGRTNYNELKSDGYRNAIEALVAARAIRKSGDEVHTICSLPQAFANIEQSDTIVFAKPFYPLSWTVARSIRISYSRLYRPLG